MRMARSASTARPLGRDSKVIRFLFQDLGGFFYRIADFRNGFFDFVFVEGVAVGRRMLGRFRPVAAPSCLAPPMVLPIRSSGKASVEITVDMSAVTLATPSTN